MVSLSVHSLTHKLSTNFLSPNPTILQFHSHNHSFQSKSSPKPLTITACFIPAKPPPAYRNLYQPFRPPPSPLPSKFQSLDTAGKIDILSNRLGLWYEYAPLIPSLFQEGFNPPSIEETTGISGVEQNRLIVGARVRESLIESGTDPDVLAEFDTGGAEVLYEIRLLSASQRAAAARFIVDNRYDAKMAQDLARSMKDFPRRRGDKGWERFDYNLPGDCLSFMYYRQALEHRSPEPRVAALEMALEAAQSEKAKSVIIEELEGKSGDAPKKEAEEIVKVSVVRLKMGEVSESRSVVVLPVCRAEAIEGEVLDAPMETKTVGDFGVVVSDKAWNRWVALPGWEPVAMLGNGGVVVSFTDARALPWKVNRWYKEEPILVVVDRERKAVEVNDGFYLVAVESGGDGKGRGLKVKRGTALAEAGVKESLGTVVLVVRPPKEDTDNQLADEEWD